MESLAISTTSRESEKEGSLEGVFNESSLPIRILAKISAGTVVPGDLQEDAAKKYSLGRYELMAHSVIASTTYNLGKIAAGFSAAAYKSNLLTDLLIDGFGVACAVKGVSEVNKGLRNSGNSLVKYAKEHPLQVVRNLNRFFICGLCLYVDAETFSNYWNINPDLIGEGVGAWGFLGLGESTIRAGYSIIKKKPIGSLASEFLWAIGGKKVYERLTK